MCRPEKAVILLNQLAQPFFQGASPLPSIPVHGIARDSRRVKPGYLFVAIQGYQTDGHQYIGEALSRGAVAVVCEKKVPLSERPCIQVSDARKALAQLAAVYYGHPSRDLSLLGITGTNGKTTTSFMAYSILKEAGFRTGLLGTILMDDGKDSFPARLTTPDTLDLHQLLYRMKRNRVDSVVMEVSSQGLKQERVYGMDFDIGIFTNLTTEHLGFHRDFYSYRQAKKRFLSLLGPQKTLLYNRDDAQVVELMEGSFARKYTFCLKGRGDFWAQILSTSPAGFRCRFFFPGGEEMDLFLRLLGRHNIYNALSAAAAAYLEDVSIHVIKKALSAFQPVSRRLQMSTLKGVLILDDTALNPASYQVVFETVQELEYDQLVLVNAIRGGRGPEINRANGRVLSCWCRVLTPKTVIITASNDITREEDRVQPDEEEAFFQGLSALPHLYFSRLVPSLHAATTRVKKGDLLLLLGAQGMDPGLKILLQKNKIQKKEKLKINRSD